MNKSNQTYIFNAFLALKTRLLNHGINLDAMSEFNILDFNYNSNNRYFHNFNHIVNLLNLLDKYVSPIIKDELVIDAMEYAIFYHDVVYNVSNPDIQNVFASIEVALSPLQQFECERFNMIVIKTILATDHSNFTHDNFYTDYQKYMIDMDLHTLGGEYKQFIENGEDIYREFSTVKKNTVDKLLKGRLAFFEKMLSRERIYLTDIFYNLYEKTARENMEKSSEIIKQTLNIQQTI